MKTLRKACKRKAIDFGEPKTQGFDESWDIDEEEVKPDPRRGWTLLNFFLASKNLPKAKKGGMKSGGDLRNSFFPLVAGTFNAWERRTGRRIDDRAFVMTMRRRYGEWFYPGHMLGREALSIYQKEMEEVYRRVRAGRRYELSV